MNRYFFSTYFFLIAAVFITIIGTGYVGELYWDHKYPGRDDQEERNISRGTFYLIEQKLMKMDEAEYQKEVDTIQAEFGFPVLLGKIEKLESGSEKKKVIEDGQIYLDEKEDSHSKRIGESGFYVTLGPFLYLELKPFEMTVFIAGTAITLGLLILCWTSYFWSKLNRIKTATSAFGRGDFSTRVKVPKFSSLSRIASAFNDMASQIERLIASHKQLVNAVSHELRTPISRIRFGLESLRVSDEEEKEQHLRGLRSDVDELDELVNELLSYTRFERMESKMELKSQPLLPWLKGYVHAAQEFIEVPLEFSFNNIDEQTQVAFDPRQLERAIHNLLQNGSRFASRMIEVKISTVESGVEIRIEDDGHGIKQKDRERVFDPFIRLDSSRNRESGGYGLGLAIVREIVRGHRGTISIEDSPHGGAAFCITFPV